MGSGPLVGIDLGTTFSALAFLNGYGRAEIVPDEDGELLLPSLVWFPPGPREFPVVGHKARKHSPTFPEGLIEFIKRDMGDPDWRRTLAGEDHTPTSISALILRRMLDYAERALGERPESAVITCPAYFGDRERQATSAAGQLAGIEVLGILNEPTAAALAYGLHHQAGAGRIRAMVYDLGGGTFDVTILELEGRRVKVIATAGEHQLGGKDWDDEVINCVAEAFQQEHGIDPRDDLAVQQDLRVKCEAAKIALSEQPSAKVFCQAFGRFFRYELTRERFDELTRSLLAQTRTYVEQVLSEARIGWKDIDTVLPVGGASRMPQVERMLGEQCGRPIERVLDPDLAVAQGAAYYAAILREEQGFEVKVLIPSARPASGRHGRPTGRPGQAAPPPETGATLEDMPMVFGANLRFRPRPIITREDKDAPLPEEPPPPPRAAPVFAVAAPKGEAARPRTFRPPTRKMAQPPSAPPGPARPGTGRVRPGARPGPTPGRERPTARMPARPAPPAARGAPAARPGPGPGRARPTGRVPAPTGRVPAPARPGARPAPGRPGRAAPDRGGTGTFRRGPARPTGPVRRPAPATPPPTPKPVPVEAEADAPSPDELDPIAAPTPAEIAAVAQLPPDFDPNDSWQTDTDKIKAPVDEDAPAAPPPEEGWGEVTTVIRARPPEPDELWGERTTQVPTAEHSWQLETDKIRVQPAPEEEDWSAETDRVDEPPLPDLDRVMRFSELAGLFQGGLPGQSAGGIPGQVAGLGGQVAGLAGRTVTDVNSRALSVLTFKQGAPKTSVMIPAHSSLPVEKRTRFFTVKDNQPGVKIVVLEGDDPDPERCVVVGECMVSGLPPRPKGQEVELMYRYDASGLLHVAAQDVATGIWAQVHIQR